jgi:hypothetical protein
MFIAAPGAYDVLSVDTVTVAIDPPILNVSGAATMSYSLVVALSTENVTVADVPETAAAAPATEHSKEPGVAVISAHEPTVMMAELELVILTVDPATTAIPAASVTLAVNAAVVATEVAAPAVPLGVRPSVVAAFAT